MKFSPLRKAPGVVLLGVFLLYQQDDIRAESAAIILGPQY